jgi:hypothetical protein
METRGGDPLLDRTMRGWIYKTAVKNYWRVASWYDLADLVQDGYLCYAKCRSKYFQNKDNLTEDERRRWFMSLVQTTFINHITDLAWKRTRTLERSFAKLDIDGIDTPVEVGMDLMVALKQAPKEIKELLHILISDAGLLTEQREEDKHRVRQRCPLRMSLPKFLSYGPLLLFERFDAVTGELYCQFAGVDACVNLRNMVVDYFGLNN